MRIGVGFFLALCLATCLFAQNRGVRTVTTGTPTSRPTSTVGVPLSTRPTSGIINPGGGGQYLVVQATHFGGSTVGSRNRGVYAYPIYVGGYYDSSYISQQPYNAPAQPQANYTVSMPPQAPVTPVVINYYYGTSSSSQDLAQDRAQPVVDEVAQEPESSHYLIAFQDHTVYAAVAYWVDGDTLHYFTSGNTHNQVSLSLVDRQFTERLNKEAGVDLKLPAPVK